MVSTDDVFLQRIIFEVYASMLVNNGWHEEKGRYIIPKCET